MKFVYGHLVLLIVSTAPLSAQLSVGFTVGQTKSSVISSRLDGLEQMAVAGYAVGLTANVGVNRHFGVSLGLAATRKGTSYALPGWAIEPPIRFDGTLTYRRKYVELSALARGVLPLWDGRASFHALLGPALELPSGCDVEFRASTGPNGSIGADYIDCRLPDPRGVIGLAQRYDLSAIGGIGAEIAIPWGMSFTAEYRYTFGLKSDGLNCEDVQNRTRTVQFGLAYPLR